MLKVIFSALMGFRFAVSVLIIATCVAAWISPSFFGFVIISSATVLTVKLLTFGSFVVVSVWRYFTTGSVTLYKGK